MKTASIIALAGAASLAAAGVTGSGAGFAIPDNDGAGASSSIVITDTGNIVDLDVSIDMEHTWVGDLIITLTNETTGTSVDITNRAGQAEGGSPTFGFNIDLNGVYVFDDASVNGSFHDQLASNNGSLSGGDYNALGSLADFNGEAVAGTWTLSVSDNAGGDTGNVRGWSIDAVVPAPGAIAIAGMGGLVAARRRRA